MRTCLTHTLTLHFFSFALRMLRLDSNRVIYRAPVWTKMSNLILARNCALIYPIARNVNKCQFLLWVTHGGRKLKFAHFSTFDGGRRTCARPPQTKLGTVLKVCCSARGSKKSRLLGCQSETALPQRDRFGKFLVSTEQMAVRVMAFYLPTFLQPWVQGAAILGDSD